MITKGYIQIPNVAFGFGTDYKLNKDDIKVYAYLQFAKSVGTMRVRTNVEIIVEDLGWETTKASRDKARVADALQNLMDKGYIKITFKKDIKKENLTIEINDGMKKAEAQSTVEWKQKPFTFKKYTEIKADEYNLAEENDYHLLMVGYYLWRNNADFEYAICDKEWAEVLELGVKRTRTIIDDYTPFLNKFSGAKYKDDNGQWKQEPNQYKMDKHMSVESKIDEAKTEVKNISHLERHTEKVTDVNVLTNTEVFHQIFNFKKYIEFKGYKAWKETTCDHVKKTGQTKIDKMIASSEGGKAVAEKLEKQYQEYLADQQRQQEALERISEKHIEDMEHCMDDEYESSYKKPESRNDISAFLD